MVSLKIIFTSIPSQGFDCQSRHLEITITNATVFGSTAFYVPKVNPVAPHLETTWTSPTNIIQDSPYVEPITFNGYSFSGKHA
jgi:hypothetical protein